MTRFIFVRMYKEKELDDSFQVSLKLVKEGAIISISCVPI